MFPQLYLCWVKWVQPDYAVTELQGQAWQNWGETQSQAVRWRNLI